jgi:tRNA pseudouridine55 synthase
MKDIAQMDFLAGEMLLFDKPLNWTSFDLVKKIRFLLRHYLGVKKIKVGHAGTLDPLATGLVIVCTGKATKKKDEYQGMAKEYIANIRLGSTTPTYDLESEPNEFFPYEHITKEKLASVINQFTGEIEQTPPIFSAIKVQGKKAYDLARKGEKVELKSRRITIYEMTVLEYNLPDITVNVKCSKGTYIRSLAYDMGKALDSGAHLTGLRRTCIGEFTVDAAADVLEFEKIILDRQNS